MRPPWRVGEGRGHGVLTYVLPHARSGRVSGRFVPAPPSAVLRFRICLAAVGAQADAFFPQAFRRHGLGRYFWETVHAEGRTCGPRAKTGLGTALTRSCLENSAKGKRRTGSPDKRWHAAASDTEL